jgi:hypothetical protein
MTKSDTPAATPSADVQAVREALTEARLWFGPLTPMRVNRAVDAAIPALDAIEKEMGMLRNDGDNAWTRYLQEKSRAVIAEARLAQMTETYNERGDRLLDASARLAKEEAALRELRDELNTRAKKFGGTEESMRASLVPIIDVALVGGDGWTCAARKQGTAGGNAPVECDWPGCGCDPYANKVLAALDEAALKGAVPEREGVGLRALLTECADELAEWVEHHYAATKDHPSEARRYERDMEPVRRARATLTNEATDD